MVEAARIVEQAGPDVIDLNFGCPVKKVAGKGAGAGMLQNIPKCSTSHGAWWMP
jgi:tRNA-U20-dihydrouridine synthase